MCLSIRVERLQFKVATKSTTLVKVVRPTDKSDEFIPWYRYSRRRYKLGKPYVAYCKSRTLFALELNLRAFYNPDSVASNPCRVPHLTVDEGIYGYNTIQSLKKDWKGTGYTVLKCQIPQGIPYLLTDKGQIVTTDVIPLRAFKT